MKRIFALAIFFSATLLFMVQPLAGKILLPVLGGSPAVWSTGDDRAERADVDAQPVTYVFDNVYTRAADTTSVFPASNIGPNLAALMLGTR